LQQKKIQELKQKNYEFTETKMMCKTIKKGMNLKMEIN
jgi:hypothetical protein